jgi:hypothetical protein
VSGISMVMATGEKRNGHTGGTSTAMKDAFPYVGRVLGPEHEKRRIEKPESKTRKQDWRTLVRTGFVSLKVGLVSMVAAAALMLGPALPGTSVDSAAAQPNQFGLVNVGVGDITVSDNVILSNIGIGVAAQVAAQLCNVNVGPVAVLAAQAARTGGGVTVCQIEQDGDASPVVIFR